MGDAITVMCSKCGKLLRCPGSAAGRKGKCAGCGEAIEIPLIVTDDASDDRPCPFCAERIKVAAIKCRHCGTMLDGSDGHKEVVVRGMDPFAGYHTPIQGMKEGRLTPIGWCGIGLGGLFVLVSVVMLFGDEGSAEEVFLTFMGGLAFGLVSFLWARKK